MADKHETIILELDPDSWKKQLDVVEMWLGNVLAVQTNLTKLVDQTADRIKEPHIKEAMEKMSRAEERHEKSVLALFKMIDREPSMMKTAGGQVLTEMVEGLFNFQDLLGGAAGVWRDMHYLTLANQHAIGAFSVAEQLALAMGIKEFVELTFPIIHDKSTHQLVLQEYMLEMAPISLLYKDSV